jgi:hypothetical protein
LNWKKGVGYSNPHFKLTKTCFGGKDKLIAAYWAAYAKSTGTNNICVAIQQAAGFTPEETALNDLLTMIILKNWSLTSVECKLHCCMCKHKTTFSYKQICMMMFILGEVVETKVSKMLKKAKAIGLYDGFTRNSTHYIAHYALFIEGEGDALFKKTTHNIILLGVSPMIDISGKKCYANDDEADETANDNNEEEGKLWVSYSHKFDAEHHIHHFRSILNAYNQEVKKLFVAFPSDNASVNRKTAKLAGVPHLPCHNHTHALDIDK